MCVDNYVLDRGFTGMVSAAHARGSVLKVLPVFLRLACTVSGEPIARLGYYRKEIVAVGVVAQAVPAVSSPDPPPRSPRPWRKPQAFPR